MLTKRNFIGIAVAGAISVQATESENRSIIWQWRIATRQKRINELKPEEGEAKDNEKEMRIMIERKKNKQNWHKNRIIFLRSLCLCA